MYDSRPNLMIGFHGCDELVRNKLVSTPNDIRISAKENDWLGHGFYVWENNFDRAFLWAKDYKKRNPSELYQPSVLGVVYQLDYCLDFTDSKHTTEIAYYYEDLKVDFEKIGKPLPENLDTPRDLFKDKIKRQLDCAVIEHTHKKIDDQIKHDIGLYGHSKYKRFDTVRGVFTEGGPAFEGAGIQSKTHIQICIRNLNCIKGFFIPRKEITFP